MRYRVKDYRVEANENGVWLYFQAPEGVTLTSEPDNEIEDYILQAIRLVVDESEDIVFCSSMQKRKYIQRAKVNVNTREVLLAFNIPSGKTVGNDMFTIEMDWGDEPGASPSADAVAQFFGLPGALPEGYEFMTPEEVCSELEDIMTAMDLELTAEQAQAITQATLTPQ